MKKLITLSLFLGVFTVCNGQLNCDTLLCGSYADSGSYKILNNPGEIGSEVILSPGVNDAFATCDMLCEINAVRKDHEDVIIWFEGVNILVYAADGTTIKIEEEDE